MKKLRLYWLHSLVLVTTIAHVNLALAVEESAVKAAFIEKLTRYIEWPNGINNSEDSRFTICVIGKDTLNGSLNELAEITEVKGRRLAIHYLKQIDEINGCNSLFISSSYSNHLTEVLKHISSRPILTLADSEGFASKGVMINFFFDGGRLRFEINPEAARSAGIKVGARVLKLARIVDSQ